MKTLKDNTAILIFLLIASNLVKPLAIAFRAAPAKSNVGAPAIIPMIDKGPNDIESAIALHCNF